MLELEQHLRRVEIDILAGIVFAAQRFGPGRFDILFALGPIKPGTKFGEALGDFGNSKGGAQWHECGRQTVRSDSGISKTKPQGH